MRGLIGFSAGLITGSLATWAVIEIGSGEPPPAPAARGAGRNDETPASTHDAPSQTATPAVSREIASADQAPLQGATKPYPRSPNSEPDPGVVAVPARTFSVVAAELEELIASGRTDRRPYKALFDDLVRVGTEESIGLVIATLEDPNVDFSWRAKVFAEALEGVDDPRILLACARKLAANEVAGLTSWTDLNGYVDLIAKSEGPAAAQTLLDLLDNDATAFYTSKAIADLSDRGRGIEFAQRLSDAPRHIGDQLVESLAGWNDPDINRRMLEAARSDPSMHSETRNGVFQELSKHAALDDVQRLLASTNPDHAQAAAYGAAGNPNLTLDQKQAVLMPVVNRGLSGEDSGRFQKAIYTLQYNEDLHTDAARQMLTGLLDQTMDANRRQEIKGTLGKMGPKK